MNDEQPATPQPAEPGDMPSYGHIPWPTLRALVAEARVGVRDERFIDVDPSYSFGHQPVSMNWNSLNRIVSTFAAAPQQPAAASAGASDEPIRLAYKTGYDEGYSDASDGSVDHDACEEGWQQYKERAALQSAATK